MLPPATRPEGQLNLNLSTISPAIESVSTTTSKSPFNNPKSASGTLSGLPGRLGAGSPSHEQASRLFKRTRELATPTGASSNIWGPPTSGTSTPLFEIPESPSQDGFPDLVPPSENGMSSPPRRGRAGTLPSRISPVGTTNGGSAFTSKTSRPTPSTSPFRPNSTTAAENAFNAVPTSAGSNSTLLSRLRAGSMPQRANVLSAGPFGQSPFTSAWSTRSRAGTLNSIHSAEEATSPLHSAHGRDALDNGVRTLDYLGLVESPNPSDSDLLSPHQTGNLPSLLGGFGNRSASSRFRSFSVNTQPKYGSDVIDSGTYPVSGSGTITPSAAAALEAEYEAVQERVRLHNQAVQAFAMNAANAARPRARTAGLVETPQRASLRQFSQLHDEDFHVGDYDPSLMNVPLDANGLAGALQDLHVGDNLQAFEGTDDVGSQMSRSLWIGSIPNSTTVSSLDAIFANYGPIESTRVLTHKNCGFVNFENVQDAVRARQLVNGKEIFPGAGPIRIGFAKAPSNSAPPSAGTNAVGDQFSARAGFSATIAAGQSEGAKVASSPAVLGLSSRTWDLADSKDEILQIVSEFGTPPSELPAVAAIVDGAIGYTQLQAEIAPIPEPSTTRVFDAPRLRDIRKRIDNGACSVQDIEKTALEMLPEVAELSSDYLGNTVVQKLFEFCSEHTKEEMLVRIAPHLAEIGVHKNGTWAAQKIIEVCKAEAQMHMIATHVHPYTVPLFLDQYGNYVLQCCLKFGHLYNNFIFQTMLSQLGEIAQGRFGARAMRACLESHHASKNQQRLLAAAIALHGVQLATSANGALLLTWLLDTCTFARRRSVLAPRLVTNLVPLCTHKVAYLTVLKVVNQRNEPEARELVVNALFFSPNDTVLEQVLSDQSSGVTLVFKILTNPFLDDKVRPDAVQNIARVLERIQAQPSQGYKRLMDEVGLSSRSSQAPAAPFAGHGHSAGHAPKTASNVNGMSYPTSFSSNMTPQHFDNANLGRSSSDSFGYNGYNVSGFQNQHAGYGSLPYPQMAPQSQFNGYQARSGNNYLGNSFSAYNTPPAPDPYRGVQQQTGSPISFNTQMSPVMGAGGFVNQQYNLGGSSHGMYGYTPPTNQGGYHFGAPVAAVHTGARGRRAR